MFGYAEINNNEDINPGLHLEKSVTSRTVHIEELDSHQVS